MTKKMKKSTIKGISEDLVNSLNKNFKSLSDPAQILTNKSVDTDVKSWHHTGSDILDLAISNQINGGWPSGRIIELMGMEGSGKSLLADYALASTQRAGGVGILIDTEASASPKYMKTIGVDLDTLVYIKMEALENIFETIERLIAKIRTSDKDIPVTIVVDSIMGASTTEEMKADYSKDGYNTAKSIILSKAMRKITNLISREDICLIFTNQLRVNMGVTFGNKYTTSGGYAVGFHSSVRVLLKKLGKITIEDKDTSEKIAMGIKVRAEVTKNRLGPPLRKVEFDIYFKSGIDNYGSWRKLLSKKNIIKSAGGWLKIKDIPDELSTIINPDTGEEKELTDNIWSFRKDEFAPILEYNNDLRKYLYNIICNKYIMEYTINKDFTSDDVLLETEDED